MKILVVTLLVVGILSAWIWLKGRSRGVAEHAHDEDARLSLTPTPDRVSVELWYPRSDLAGVDSVRVEVPDHRASLTDWAKTIVGALSHSPNPSLIALFPPNTEPTVVFVDEQQNLYLDFPSTVVTSVPSGVERETLTLKALFQSISETMPKVEGVKFLIDGEDRETWGGHVDIQRFFPIRPLSRK